MINSLESYLHHINKRNFSSVKLAFYCHNLNIVEVWATRQKTKTHFSNFLLRTERSRGESGEDIKTWTRTDWNASCVTLSHVNATTQEKKNSHFPCQSPRPIVSDPSTSSVIIADPPPHRYSHPFQVAGRWGPKRRFCLTTSGLITREATTSEHCVESRRHTGKESALYLGSSNNNYPHPYTNPLPTSTSLPPNINHLWEASAVGTPGFERRGKEKEERKSSCSLQTPSRSLTGVCQTWCQMWRFKHRRTHSGRREHALAYFNQFYPLNHRVRVWITNWWREKQDFLLCTRLRTNNSDRKTCQQEWSFKDFLSKNLNFFSFSTKNSSNFEKKSCRNEKKTEVRKN